MEISAFAMEFHREILNRDNSGDGLILQNINAIKNSKENFDFACGLEISLPPPVFELKKLTWPVNALVFVYKIRYK